MTKEDIKQICQIYDNFRSERDVATIAYNSDDTFWEHILATYNLSQSSLPSNLDEAVQPEWRKAPISFMGGAIIKTSIGPMYSDHVVAGQLYLKFEELHLLPGYDEN